VTRPPLRWLLTFISFAVAIGVSVYVIGSSWPDGGAPLGLPWWAHLVLLGGVGLEILFRVLKLTFSAAAVGLTLPFGVATRTILGGDFAASITPSRSGSEPARFLVLKEGGVPMAGAVLILFLELFLEMLSLMIATAIFAVIWWESAGVVSTIMVTVGIYAAVVLSTGALGVTLARRRAHGPPPSWAAWFGLGAGRWRKVQMSLRQLRSSVGSLRGAHRGLMTAALGFSVLHVLARLLPLPVIMYSYGDRSGLAPLILWPLALLYGAAVAPAPGGGGVVEIAFKAALGSTLPARLVATSLIWWRVYTFYVYIAIGAFAAGRTVMRALQHRDHTAEEPGEPQAAASAAVATERHPLTPA
jgi:uncharacterized protein (TIRG00374 family)